MNSPPAGWSGTAAPPSFDLQQRSTTGTCARSLLYSLHTQQCAPARPTDTSQVFRWYNSDGLILKGNDTAYKEENCLSEMLYTTFRIITLLCSSVLSHNLTRSSAVTQQGVTHQLWIYSTPDTCRLVEVARQCTSTGSLMSLTHNNCRCIHTCPVWFAFKRTRVRLFEESRCLSGGVREKTDAVPKFTIKSVKSSSELFCSHQDFKS